MSFEAAMARLGGTSISVGSIEASSMAKGETLADTIRVVSGYADAIVLRHRKKERPDLQVNLPLSRSLMPGMGQDSTRHRPF